MTQDGLTEAKLVEQPALKLLEELGWTPISAYNEVLGEAGTLGRDSRSEAVLARRLLQNLVALNPELPHAALEQAVDRLFENRSAMDRSRANREVWQLLRDGASVTFLDVEGKQQAATVRYLDWSDVNENDWLAVSQLWIRGPLYERRADIVLFVNGIPLVLVELKVSHKNVRDAYDDNLRDYRDTIGHVFWFNSFVILSNGSDTRVGSTYAPWEGFSEWKKIDSEGEGGLVSLETVIRGTCEPARLLDLAENFVAYTERPGGLVKSFARNHQYLGVNNVVEALGNLKGGDGRLGVFWHTQGSGKSLSMLWFTQKVLRKQAGNWTFVLVTDRKELDDQLYGEFADSGVITAGAEVHAESSAHLRELLAQDHRYVFTLIHKFIPPEAGAEMPVLSDRDDIIVITDEAHRSQYDTLAANMRKALPNASFLGFTGTPLIVGEEETKRVFGDYVSVYNFTDSIIDGATVPLYYENRSPEIQLTNEAFDEELEELLEEAELDEAQEKAVARRFGQQYQLITRPQRLAEVAKDLVHHFVNRGFRGKGMYVGIDKATAIRMYDLVQAAWGDYRAELDVELESTPEPERPHLESLIAFMDQTDMAVVVSQSQNEVADMEELRLDIKTHRKRIVSEDLDSNFKDPDDPLRLVFVCAMWITGFDAPATSTVYLDKPMRNHSLMQTIARANRVFPDKDNGLIVDYVGVFRNLEKALAIYAVDRADAEADTPIRPKDELITELGAALNETQDFLAQNDVDLGDLDQASGFEFIALQKAAVEALLIDEGTRRRYVALARWVRTVFKSLLPAPEAMAAAHRVAVIRTIASKIESESEAPDIAGVMDSVSELLDRSVGAKEYVIRTASDADPLIDLNKLDFEQLAHKFATNKRTAAKAMEKRLERRLDRAVRKNPTRLDLAERFRQLIDDYNAGTHNLEEFLRRLKAIHDELSDEEQRLVREDLSEAELAIFDLLTKTEPELTDADAEKVKHAARRLLAHVEETLVMDWRRRQQTRSAVRVAVGTVLDEELPEVYGPELFDRKVDAIYEHIYASYFDDGSNVYVEAEAEEAAAEAIEVATNVDDMTDGMIEKLQENPSLFARFMEAAFGATETWAQPIEQLLGADETRVVEYKQTARWNVKEERKDRAIEQVIVKTIAGLLNDRGGTLLIGVTDDRRPVGLEADYRLVKPSDPDGYVNWLDTMLETNLGHVGAHRLQIRIERIEEIEVCRIDVPASSRPIWVKSKAEEDVLYQRRNNSTRQVPPEEVDDFIAERFPDVAQREDFGELAGHGFNS